MKKFIIFSKESVQSLPPISSIALAANDLGYEVIINTQNINNEVREILTTSGIKVNSIENKIVSNKLLKAITWYKYAKFANKKYRETSSDDIIWLTGANTIISMGIWTLKKREFYLQINELYDDAPFFLRQINKIAQHAKKIIVPEKNRAVILQVWFKLGSIPNVLPNKPYINEAFLRTRTSKYSSYISLLEREREKGKRILLYQGLISFDRDVSTMLKVANIETESLTVVLMGEDFNMLSKYKKICPSLIHIPNIPSPFHLLITQLADIGMLVYLPTSLNNIYCAPNKVWEYTRYGLSLLGNNIPGLNIITEKQLGFQIDINDEATIASAIKGLIQNGANYKANSLAFFQQYNFEENLKQILS